MMIRIGLLELAVLLLVVLAANSLDTSATKATGCLACLKKLLPTKSPYKRLAIRLYEATRANDLASNTRAAELLLENIDTLKSEIPDEYETLLEAFASLSDTSLEELCDKYGMRNLHRLAEAMSAEREPISTASFEAVSRLDRIVVRHIKQAQSRCVDEFDRVWQNAHRSCFAGETGRLFDQLDLLPRTLMFLPAGKSSTRVSRESDKKEEQDFIRALERILARGQSLAIDESTESLSTGGTGDKPRTVDMIPWSRESISEYLGRFIREPCEAVLWSVASQLALQPFVNLIMATHYALSKPGSNVEDFFTKLLWKSEGSRKEIVNWAFRWGACAKIKTYSDEDLINRLLLIRPSVHGSVSSQ